MNWLMTSAPLAMRLCGLSQADAKSRHPVARSRHVRPSFVTGWIISRITAPKVVAAGLGIAACAVLLGLSGMSVWHFWGSLVLLGLGWNFGFVGASAMVLDCYRPEERTRVQSMNDFAVFGSMVVGIVPVRQSPDRLRLEDRLLDLLRALLLAVTTLWSTGVLRSPVRAHSRA